MEKLAVVESGVTAWHLILWIQYWGACTHYYVESSTYGFPFASFVNCCWLVQQQALDNDTSLVAMQTW